MEEFRSNFIRNCREIGVAPSDLIMSELRDRKTPGGVKEELGLDFSGNNLSIQDCAILAKTLSNDRSIEELRFSDCLLTEEACRLLLNYLSSNRSVRKLDLKGNNIRSSAELVGPILKRTTALTHLSLEWNGIGLWDTGLASIAEGLQVNQTLRYLDLRNNQISHEGATFLANSLKINKFLKVLDLRWNNIGLLGAKAFLGMLKTNKDMIKLELSGNNIPNDVTKAIDSALQRNVDCQASCQEQKALSATYKHQLESIETDKNSQISSLVDKLAREKEIYSNSVRSAKEKTEQLKEALEERRSAFSTLQEKYAAAESSLRLSDQTNKQKQEHIDSLKSENSRKEKEHNLQVDNLKEQLEMTEKTHKNAIRVIEDENSNLRKKNRDLVDEVGRLKDGLEDTEKKMKDRDDTQHKTLKEMEWKYSNEIDKLVSESGAKKQADFEKYQRLEQTNCRLEEEVSQLKSKLMSEKLKAEEELMNLRMTLKQEEMNRSRQFEERIELLQSARNEIQIKNTKQNAELSDLQSRLSNNEREGELLKRQCEHLKQQIDSREADHRNEVTRSKSDLDSEKRLVMQLKDKISEVEMRNGELEKRSRDSIASRDNEISYLKTQIASKDEEMARNRVDEIKRAEMLENALKTYITSTKKLR